MFLKSDKDEDTPSGIQSGTFLGFKRKQHVTDKSVNILRT